MPRALGADPAATIGLDGAAWAQLGAVFQDADDGQGETPRLATAMVQTAEGAISIGVVDYGENATYLLVPGVEPQRLATTEAVLDVLEAAGALRRESDLLDLAGAAPGVTIEGRMAALERKVAHLELSRSLVQAARAGGSTDVASHVENPAATQSAATSPSDLSGPASAPPQSMGLGSGVDSTQNESEQFSPQRVIALAGHSGSGKTAIAKRLVAEHPDWARISCGEFVRAVAEQRGLSLELPVTHPLGQQLVEELGPERFLEEVLKLAAVSPDANKLVIDDIYHVGVFEALRRRWTSLQFVPVDLPESLRRQVFESRGLSEEEVEEVEGSALDREADRLLEIYGHGVPRLAGASDAAEVGRRSRELFELAAAA